ncbi:MAG: thioredoxin family protein [Syntrophobacteraceae bacterium]
MKWIKSRVQFEEAMVGKLALVGFCAPWCSSCRLQEPILDRLSTRFAGSVFIGALNIDEHKELAKALDIRCIPTLLIFRDGIEIHRFVGLHPEASLAEAVAECAGQGRFSTVLA